MITSKNLHIELYEELLADERILSSVLDNLNSGVALINSEGKFISYNERFLQLFGLSEDSTIKNVNDQNWSEWQVFNENMELIDVDDHPVRKASITGKKVKNQLVGVRLPSGGDIIWMLISADPVYNNDGSIEKTVCTYLDFTEQILSKIALQKSEQNFRSLVTASSEVLFRMSPDWKEMLLLNSQGFLADSDGANPDWVSDYIHPDDQTCVLSAIVEAIRNKSTFELEHRVHMANGSWGWALSRAIPILDSQGEITEWFGAASDITRRKQAEEALRESEEKFSSAFRSNPSAIVLSHEEDGIIIDVNDTFLTFFGWSREEVIGNSSLDLNMYANPEDRNKAIGILHKEGRLLNYEIRIKRRSGEERTVLLSIELFRVNRKNTMLTTIQDITERKQIEDRLQIELKLHEQRSAELNAIIESIPEAFYIGTREGITQCNSMGLKMIGVASLSELQEVISIENLYKKFNVRSPDSGNPLPDNEIPFLKALNGEVSIVDLLATHQQTGKDVFLRSANAPVIVNGEIVAAIVINSDLTERRQIEQEAKSRAIEIEAILSCIADGVLVYDKEGRIMRSNSTADKIMQFSVEEGELSMPERISRGNGILTEDGRTLKQEEMPAYRAYANGETIRNQVLLVQGRGDPHWLSISAAPLMVSDKRIGAVISLSDITKRKAYEKAILDNENRLRELNATKDKLFTIISHDLKSPFTSILGFSDLLIEKIQKNETKDIEAFATVIRNSSRSAMDLLANIIEWSRLQTGRLSYNPAEIDIILVVKEVLDVLSVSARQKSINISTTMPGRLNVFADKLMIGTVLRNLISNSIKFTQPGGDIMISVIKQNKETMVEVSDNGIGMEKEVIEKLFDPDANISRPGTQNETGTGLGMIICKEFITKHGGELWAESEISKGSKFVFTLPVSSIS